MKVMIAILLALLVGCRDDRPPEQKLQTWKPTPEQQAEADKSANESRARHVGERLVKARGCLACHQRDGSVAPAFEGLWARSTAGTTKFVDGTTLADKLGPGKQYPTVEDYVRAKTLWPRGDGMVWIEGYPPAAPSFGGVLTDQEMNDIIAYLRTL
jgi:mono/diheme cytochrome c family protein